MTTQEPVSEHLTWLQCMFAERFDMEVQTSDELPPLGVDSLMTVEVALEIRRRYDIPLGIICEWLYSLTIEEIATHLSSVAPEPGPESHNASG